MSEIHHETVYFSGRVQGVGFRYTTLQVAKEFEVSGWVKNLADGRVQLEAEGKPETIKAFLAAIDERLHGFIRKTERQGAKRPAEFAGFTIR
jgi:acylphosphatase